MAPTPSRSALATRLASGFNSSSTGPMAPSEPASFRVWQTAHAGLAPTVNSCLPSSIWAASSAAGGAPALARPAASRASAGTRARNGRMEGMRPGGAEAFGAENWVQW